MCINKPRIERIKRIKFVKFVQFVAYSASVNVISQSTWGYPIVSAIHVLGMALFGGTVLVTDLRILGVRPNYAAGDGSASSSSP